MVGLLHVQAEAVKEVRSAQEYAALARDPRMEELFNAFDKNHDGAIDFKVPACLPAFLSPPCHASVAPPPSQEGAPGCPSSAEAMSPGRR